jgi:diguanylate cyclase (GGDEF)-like protein
MRVQGRLMKGMLANATRPWASLACALATIAGPAIAAPRPMYFDRFDLDSGLSQLTVNAIAQDATGFLWVGTEDGLDRFDGYAFRRAGADSRELETPRSFVACIERNADGGLWLAPDGDGVMRQDPLTGELQRLSARGQQPVDDGLERVRVVRADRTGELWIGSRDAGLARYGPRDGHIERFRHDPHDAASLASDAIFALLEDRRGTLWIGTEDGLDTLAPGAGAFRHQPLPMARPPLVRALLQDRSGALWIGTNAGLVELDSAGRVAAFFTHSPADARSLPANTVNTLLEDSAGRLWVGTTAGLALLDGAHAAFDIYTRDASDPRSLPDDHVVSLFQDRSGLIWIGTKFGGLAKWNPRSWSFGHHPAVPEEGFASRNVMAFTEDPQQRTWIAAFDGGITILDPRQQRPTTLRHEPARPDSLSDDRVMALLTDHEGVIWAGTMSGGLDRIVPRTLAITVFLHDAADPRSLGAAGVMSLFEDSAHRLWVGTYGGGLSLFDRATRTFRRFRTDPADPASLSADRVTALAEDAAGTLWVGTDGGGVNALDPVSGRFTRFQHDPHDARSLSADTVYSLNSDARGRVWVGTRGGGLNLVIGSGSGPASVRFEHFTEKDGLPNDTIYGIHADAAGYVWVSTNYGLARIDAERRVVRSFHRAQGLQGEEFNFGAHYASRSGKLFFGGNNGYNAFSPAALQFNSVPPSIVLTSVTVPDRPAITGAAAGRLHQLHLPYRDDVVTFEFAALDYAAPLANSFQYRLDGSDGSWVSAGNRHTVTYAKLPSGRYALRVRASNADGTWSAADIAIPLTVDPPPWKSTLAYGCYALATALLIFASWRMHRSKLAREAAYSRKLEQQVRERTHQLAAHASALEQANRRLEEVSVTDPLTSLGNRRSLKHSVPRMIANIPRGGRIALMVVDLDCMKPINDEHGHDAGDRVLIGVGRILRDSIRGCDNVVRWGGDEFVVVHACNDLDAAAALAEHMRHAVAHHRFTIAGKVSARTSCSIGFALYPFVRAAPGLVGWEDVLRIADGALYRAKGRRNAWVGWSGRRAVADLCERVLADPDAAQAGQLIRARTSNAVSGETIEMLLRRPRASGDSRDAKRQAESS